MSTEDFKKDDGYEYDGCFYDCAESVVLSGMLGWCGCGAPDLAGTLVRDTLQSMKDYHDNKITWEQRDNLFKDERVRYFVYYVLEDKGLTEHGGSVNGSWLTEKGEEVLTYLTEIYKEEDTCS